MKLVQITEADSKFRLGLAEILMREGLVPVVFEAPDDYDLDSYHGLDLFQPTDPHAETPAQQPFAVRFPAVVAWLEAYTGTFDFYLSLKGQLADKGYLSEKQIACVERAIERDKQRGIAAPEGKPQEFDLKPGAVLVLSKFIATKVAQQAGYTRAHRAVEVVSVEAETAKAYLATVKLTARRTSHCGICGLTLENPESIAAGIGPICAEKYGVPYGGASLEAVAALLQTTASVKTWIPKRSIKERKDV